MPEINQYTFSHAELVEAMIKKADVREGKWVIAITFGFGAGNFGANEEEAHPGAIVGVQKIGIQRAQADTPLSMQVDAAVVNPRQSKAKK